MPDEYHKESEDLFMNKKSNNIMDDISDNKDNNYSYITEPSKLNDYNNNFLINIKMKNNDTNNSMNSNNNNSILKDLDIIYNSENQFSKTEYKQKLLEDNIEYEEFTKKKFDTNVKKNENEEIKLKLDLNNKELMKRYEELIEDNKLLNSALNERTSKLNQIIKENISLKSQNKQLKLSAKNKDEKIKLYEEQLQFLKNKNEIYEKTINKLENQKEKLNVNENDKNEFKKNENMIKKGNKIIMDFCKSLNKEDIFQNKFQYNKKESDISSNNDNNIQSKIETNDNFIFSPFTSLKKTLIIK
jgi:hypothetical protein